MIKARKGIKNPRQKTKEILIGMGFCPEYETENADSYIGKGLKIIVDFSDNSISWLVPQKTSVYYIGRILKFDPALSGDELAEMVVAEAVEIDRARREEVRE